MKKLTILLLGIITTVFSLSAQKAGFVGKASSLSALADDDEKAAATWFVDTYGGDYIPVSEIGTKDLSAYSGLWIMNDREDGTPDAYEEFYAVSEQLSTYYKNGGNLVLSVHATNLLTEFGRVSEWPDLTGAGIGGENPDVWQICPVYGTWEAGQIVHDNIGDPLYAGMETQDVERGNGNIYKVIPVIGNSWKEDHNCFWSLNTEVDPKTPAEEARLSNWESNYNCDVLGTWGHVQDYFGAAVVRWKSTETYKGKCITIGIGGCEWEINNSGVNPYHSNIVKLFENSLNEISVPSTNTGILNPENAKNEGKVFVKANVLVINDLETLYKAEVYSISGNQVLNSVVTNNTLNISALSKGAYIVKLSDNSNTTLGIHKFLK